MWRMTALLWVLLAPLAWGQEKEDEYEVKAALLQKFAIYCTWPDAAFAKKESPIEICVFGKDPFGKKIDNTLKDKTAQDRPIEIKRADKIDAIGKPHILFVPDTEKEQLGKILEKLKGVPAIVISESDGLAGKGSVFNFYVDPKDKRLKAEVNPKAAEKAGVQISSKLLKALKVVEE